MATRITIIPKEVRHRRAVYLSNLAHNHSMSKSDVAAALRVDLSYASRLLDGHRTPSLEVACRISGMFEVPLAELARVVLGQKADGAI